MAKRIKAIKCPQCGSTKAKELRTDYYQCKACHTEFFIDSDDININHKYDTPLKTTNAKPVLIVIGILVGIFIFFNIIRAIFAPEPSSNYTPPTPVIVEEKEEEVIFWDHIDEFNGFANVNGEGMILVIGSRGSKKGINVSEEKNPSFGIYQAIDKKEIFIKPIRGLEKIEISSAEVKSFENGDVYAVINKKKLFKLNTKTYELEEVIFQSLNLPELSEGVFGIEFAYQNDGFEVVNELGKSLFYLPIINKVYTKDAFYSSRTKKMPTAKKQVAFQFSRGSEDFPNEKRQLIKYYYWSQIGYPTHIPYFQWRKDYGGSGIFTENSPYRKVLVLPYIAEISRLISLSDFTPNRNYISGKVLAYNDKEVLISFKPTLSGNTIIQILDAKTAEIKWTMPSDTPHLITNEDVIKVKDGFLFTEYEKSWLFNMVNKESKYIEWDFR